MANGQNLRPRPPWKPGESGNPAGSSQRARFTAALMRKLEKDAEGLEDEFIEVAWKAAMSGDFNFWRYLYDRIEGPIKDRIEHSGELVIRVEYEGEAGDYAGHLGPEAAAEPAPIE